MSQYSPQSPYEFAILEQIESEETDTEVIDITPTQESEEVKTEEEVADTHHLLLFPNSVEKRSLDNKPTMKTNTSSTSSSASGDQVGEENTMSSDSGDFSTHTSPDSPHQPPSRSVSELKPISLKMKGFTPLPSPNKRPLCNSPEEDDSQKKKMKIEDKDGDEISILKSILDYYSKNGIYPFADSTTLNDFIKNSLQGVSDPTELNDKIQELRGKFMKIVDEEGEKSVLLGPSDQEAFELSKKIWGDGTDIGEDHLSKSDGE